MDYNQLDREHRLTILGRTTSDLAELIHDLDPVSHGPLLRLLCLAYNNIQSALTMQKKDTR